jgi:DNA-binding transcriptional LysR family regulator
VRVELEHLRTFLAVYRTGALTRAASQLHLSQPAVTAHVKALEAELGRPLFVRLARGVTPTALADQLAHEVTAPLDALTSLAATFASGAGVEDATLLLGGPADCLAVKVIPALVPFTTAGLRVRARTGLTKELMSDLGAGELDVVIATTPTRQRGVTVQPLFDETLVLVASPTVARRLDTARLRRGDPSGLGDVALLAFAENVPLVRRYWRSVFGSASAPSARIVLDDLRGLITALTADAGVSVVPSYLAQRELDTGELVLLADPADPPTNTLYVAHRSGRPPRHVAAVVDHLTRLARAW